MASQSLNHSDESVPVDHAAVEDHNHGRYPNHQADAAVAEYREVNVDQLSESDFEEMRDSGLPYGDHDYLGSNPTVKCPPETSHFPVMHGVTDQYLSGETSDPCVDRPDNRLIGTAPPIPAPGTVMRRPPVPGGTTIFRPAKDFAHSGPSQLLVPAKSVPFKNVTQPKKSGRPPRNDAIGNDRLIGRAIVKAGIQTQQGHHMQPHLQPQQSIHAVQDLGLTVRGAAPLVTPARGQKVMPRGRSAALTRRDLPDASSGSPLVPAQQLVPAYRSISPKKQGTQFRSAQAAEEAHTREMMEAAQNALAPANVTLSGLNVMPAPNQLHHPIVLPVQHQQQQSVHHLNDGDLPRTPGKGHSLTHLESPLAGGSRRTISESQETNLQLLQEPLRTNSDGLPVTPGGTPGGTRKTPARSRTPRSRMSISESTGSSSQAVSPQRALVVSPSRQAVLQQRPLHPSPHRPILHSGHIKSPSGPSTMASAQMQMSSNAPMPSLPHQAYHQQAAIQRHVGQSPPGRVYYDVQGSQAAPLITATGSNTYTPRRRKEKETEDAVQAEVSRNVKTILQADKTHRLSTTSSHTLSPRNDGSDDESTRWGRKEERSDERKERKRSASKRTNHKQWKREVKEASESEGEGDWIVSCICGQQEDDGEQMVGCDKCKLRWEHVDCIFPLTKKAPEGNYICHYCDPRPTQLTREQARAYQDRVKEQKERQSAEEIQRKLKERVKRKEENSRKPIPSVPRSTQLKGHVSKPEKYAPPSYRELDKNEYSSCARRLLTMNRSSGGDLDIVKQLRTNARARWLIVDADVIGVASLHSISPGDYIVELLGHVCLQNECANRDLVPGSLTDQTFLIELEDEKLIIDSRRCGNFARHVRRSCKPNAELNVIRSGSDLHVMLMAKEELTGMVEITIAWEEGWKKQPRPAQECACKRGEECEVEKHFSKKKMDYVQSVASSSRRSLPTNGTTPKMARSPVLRAVTEKKSASEKKIISKKGTKKGTIKLPRRSRKSKGGSSSIADESEGDTEKEYEESTADEKEREESEKPSRRGRRNTGSSSEVKKEKEEEEAMEMVTTTRSSTRSRIDSDVKKEVEVPRKNEKKRSIDNNRSESGVSKKGGRRSEVEKDAEVKEEIKDETSSPSTQRVTKVKKPWPTMNYVLPSERNKPSREERKAQAYQATFEQIEKKDRKSRGSSSRGRPPSTPAVDTKGEKRLSSGRGKRKTEMEEEAGRADSVTAAASTPLLPPPTKRWAAAEGKTEEEKESSAPSSLSSMHSPLREETVVAATQVLSGKKRLLQRYQQGQKEKEKAAAEAAAKKKLTSPTLTPTRSKRSNKKEEMGVVEALVDMGGVEEKGEKGGGLREEMKRHALQCRESLAVSTFSLEKMEEKEGSVQMGCTRSEGEGREAAGGLPVVSLSHSSPATTPIENVKTAKKNLSLEDYKKRKATGGSGSGGMKKDEGERKEESAKKSFMPSVDASASVSTSLPHVTLPLPGLEESVGLDELQRRLYGDTTKREGSTAAKTESTPKRLSINERLKNEFALPIRSSASAPLLVATPSAPPSAVAVASAPSPSSLSTAGQLTPTGRTHKNRLSDARATNVDPPGLMMECPPPSSLAPARLPSNSSATPSTSSTSFINRAASIRSSK